MLSIYFEQAALTMDLMAGMSSTVALSRVSLLSGGDVELRIVAMMTEGQRIQTIECLSSRLFRKVGCGSLLGIISSLTYVVSQDSELPRRPTTIHAFLFS